MVIETIDASLEGIYTVTISAWLNSIPFFYATDTIVFTVVLALDKCGLMWFDTQVWETQTFTIAYNQVATSFTFPEFEDWVTRDTDFDCGDRLYAMTGTGVNDFINW